MRIRNFNLNMSLPVSISHSTLQNVLLWFLLTAGALKPFMFYLNIPVDLTLLAVILALVDILFSCFTRKDILVNRVQLLAIGILVVFYGLICLSVFYTPSPGFSWEKTVLFSVDVLYFIYPLFLRNLNLKLLVKLYLFIFLPIAIWFFLARVIYFSSWDASHQIIRPEFYEIRQYYLGLGIGVSVLIILLTYLKKAWIYSLIALLTILGLGTRGALIFLLLLLAIWKWKSILLKFNRVKIKSKTTFITTSAILVLLVAFYDKIYGFIAVGLERFSRLFADTSTEGRIERIEFTFNTIFESPLSFLFGKGVGSFGLLYTGQDIRDYPHNIFLETWFELGILGLLLMVFFLGTPYFYKRPVLLKIIAIFMLLNALKSGDLAGAWLLFLSYGLLIFNPKLKF